MTTQEKLEDAEIALHIAQADRNKWKARAIKLAKFLGIRDCEIDDFELAEHGDLKDVNQMKFDCCKILLCPTPANCDNCYYHVVREKDIRNSPTIIPATKGKENADSDQD